MDIEMEDYPKGFFGTGNWEDVALSLKTFGFSRRGHRYGKVASYLGISRVDDLEDPETAALVAEQKRQWSKSWYAMQKAKDPKFAEKRRAYDKAGRARRKAAKVA